VAGSIIVSASAPLASTHSGVSLVDANEAAAEVIVRNQERLLVSHIETAEAAYTRSLWGHGGAVRPRRSRHQRRSAGDGEGAQRR
jgi:hypothetical protein